MSNKASKYIFKTLYLLDSNLSKRLQFALSNLYINIATFHRNSTVLLAKERPACKSNTFSNNLSFVSTYNNYYYMDSGILLGTKTLVELIRHYIRDTVRVFPYVTLRGDITFPPFCVVFFQNGRRVQGLWS